MSKPTIILTKQWPTTVENALEETYELIRNQDNKPFDAQDMRNALRKADGIGVTVTDSLGPEVFEGLQPRARIIANFGVGYSHIDAAGAASCGITVTNTPDVLSDCTADLAMTLLLMITRRAGEGERLVRAGQWEGWHPTQMMGRSVTGKTLGIIGFGRIGQAMAKRAHFGFGMKVLALKRSPISNSVLRETGAEQAGSLNDLLQRSDFVSLHCPGGDANRHLIGVSELQLMKETAFLINTARGEVVDEKALVSALQNRKIAGAGLDVFENEPALHPGLSSCPNAVLLPHLGSATLETREAMGFRVKANLDAFFAGKTPPDKVN